MGAIIMTNLVIETDYEMACRIFTKEDILSRIVIDEETGCWLWQGTINHKGYGQLSRAGRTMMAHKISYFLFVGTYNSSRRELHHKCTTKKCANYNHLE